MSAVSSETEGCYKEIHTNLYKLRLYSFFFFLSKGVQVKLSKLLFSTQNVAK